MATDPLRPRDFLTLAIYCLVLFCFPLVFNRTFTAHETVGCVSIREMRLDHDLVIPHYGGRPWLERPPLPFWLTMPLIAALGDASPVYRLPPLLMGTLCVLLVGWMAAVWYGRTVGLVAGLIQATVREFTHYSTAPECDIFLCAVVTSALALFVHLEFRRRPADGEGGFVGRRPWALLAFFVVLGLSNVVKGLIFGDLMILLPVAAFLLLGADRWAVVKRYVWLPGWLAFAAAAGAWATAAYLRYPDVVELWKSDYVGRYNQGYMREPAWYYLVHLPWVLFPWTLFAFAGLAVTWRRAWHAGRTPERFLWCWAIAPVVFLSVPQGKHHHYLLHLIAPWAVLAAVGAAHVAERLRDRAWLRPAVVAAFALLIPLHWAGHALPPLVDDRYAGDRAFVEQVKQAVPPAATLVILDDCGPLDASWLLYYLDGRAGVLHNETFLRDARLPADEVFVITRRLRADLLRQFGSPKVVFESAKSREEHQGVHMRYGLYHLRFHAGQARRGDGAYISPMQATGRRPGPRL